MTQFQDLDAVIAAMAAHGAVSVDSYDNTLSPGVSVPDTTLYADIPGARRQHGPGQDPYTHCIHRYTVIGGEDITWVSPESFGSTTRGAFGDDVAEDDVIEQIWTEILDELRISPDPHVRPPN